jgi:hypothetical protein
MEPSPAAASAPVQPAEWLPECNPLEGLDSGLHATSSLKAEAIAWEGDRGFWARLFLTIGQVLFQTNRAFLAPALPGLGWALSFGAILSTLGFCFSLFWSYYQGDLQLSRSIMMVLMVLSPLMALASIFISAWIFHLCLLIVRGAQKGFQATFRVVGYSQAVSIFFVIPLIGSYVGTIWSLVVASKGLARVHGIGTGRAFLAVIMPLLFILLITILVIAWVVGRGINRSTDLFGILRSL